MGRYRTEEEKAVLVAYAYRRSNWQSNPPGSFQSALSSVMWSLTMAAPRAVDVLPAESWQESPQVYEE